MIQKQPRPRHPKNRNIGHTTPTAASSDNTSSPRETSAASAGPGHSPIRHVSRNESRAVAMASNSTRLSSSADRRRKRPSRSHGGQRRIVPINEQYNLLIAGNLQQLYEHAKHRGDLVRRRRATRNAFDVTHLCLELNQEPPKAPASGRTRPKEHRARRRNSGATPRSARKVQRYHRIASILIPIAPAVCIPNLSIGKQTLTTIRPPDAPEKP